MKIFSSYAESMCNDLQPVLLLAGEELIFFSVTGVGLCFGSVLNTGLIIQIYFFLIAEQC